MLPCRLTNRLSGKGFLQIIIAKFNVIVVPVIIKSNSQVSAGIPNSPRDTEGDTKCPQVIWYGDAKFPRLYSSGIPKTGEVKFSVTPGRCPGPRWGS